MVEPIEVQFEVGSEDDPTTTATNALNDVMKTEEGRKMVANLREQLAKMGDKFKSMSPEEKEKFQKEFTAKFASSFDKLKGTVQEKVTQAVQRQIYLNLFIVLIVVLLVVGILGSNLD